MSSSVQAWCPKWSHRDEPLAPVAAWFETRLLELLRLRLLSFTQTRLALLNVIVAREGVLILGDADALPWIDGAIWLGRDEAANELLQPTLWQTDVPSILLRQACFRKTKSEVALLYPCSNEMTYILPIETAEPLTSCLYPDSMVDADESNTDVIGVEHSGIAETDLLHEQKLQNHEFTRADEAYKTVTNEQQEK